MATVRQQDNTKLWLLIAFIVLAAVGYSVWSSVALKPPTYPDADQRWLPMDSATVQRLDGSYTPDRSAMVINREDYATTYVDVDLNADTLGRLRSAPFDVRLTFENGSVRVCEFRDSHLFGSGPLTETAYCEFRLTAAEMEALERAEYVHVGP